jgi:Zn-dependent protease
MDGGRILVGLLPWRQANLVARIEPYGFFIVLALLIAGVISNLWMRPLMGLTEQFINLVLTPLRLIL